MCSQRRPTSDVREDVARITAPTLVLHARDSQVFPARDAWELAAAIPGARYVELDGQQPTRRFRLDRSETR